MRTLIVNVESLLIAHHSLFKKFQAGAVPQQFTGLESRRLPAHFYSADFPYEPRPLGSVWFGTFTAP